MVVINTENPQSHPSEFLEDLIEMKEVVAILKEVKKQPPSEDWFVMWDNKKPRPGQEEDLMMKIAKLEPYTHRTFIEADKEIKARINAQIQDSVQRETTRLKREFQDDQVVLKAKLTEMEEQFAKNKHDLLKAREDAVKIAQKAQKILDLQKDTQDGFSWKDTLIAGAVGYRYGPIGALISALAVNLFPTDIFDETNTTTTITSWNNDDEL